MGLTNSTPNGVRWSHSQKMVELVSFVRLQPLSDQAPKESKKIFKCYNKYTYNYMLFLIIITAE